MFGIVLAVLALILIVLAVAVAARSGSGFERIARCSAGHYFTSTVVPGASFKAVRLGRARFQKCPVGDHWSIVRWVDPASLTDEQRAQAATHRDSRVP
jgi:hypothetical protein